MVKCSGGEYKYIHVRLKKECECKNCGMWPWKVPKWPWFLTEVAVKPFWDLATLIFFLSSGSVYHLHKEVVPLFSGRVV
jgi:hypothetical protein